MEQILETILLFHKNKRISIKEIDTTLKEHGVNILIDSEHKNEFIHIMKKFLESGILEPLKSAKTLQQYGQLPNRYTLHKGKIPGKKPHISQEHVHELMALSPSISIDYYATHPDQYKQDRQYIQRINELICSKDCVELTANERSYLIFGDEKAITAPKEAAVDGNIILKNLKLDIVDIRAKSVFEPFFFYEKGFSSLKGTCPRTILIVENKDTFWTLQDAILTEELDGIHLIIYGEGNAILKKFEYIEIIEGVHEDNYYYFGDIDQEGISIYNRLRARYPDYDIKVAVSLYHYILQKAGPENAQPLRKKRNMKSFSLSPFIDFFEESNRDAICKIIQQEKYLPQEVINKTDIQRLNQIELS